MVKKGVIETGMVQRRWMKGGITCSAADEDSDLEYMRVLERMRVG